MKKPEVFKFRLYIVGDAPNSRQATANLRALCHEHLPGRHEIEIVDALLDPQRALADGVLITPLLVRISPAPIRKIVGSLSRREPMLEVMGLPVWTHEKLP
jgi:circadian clock protein KaiB